MSALCQKRTFGLFAISVISYRPIKIYLNSLIRLRCHFESSGFITFRPSKGDTSKISQYCRYSTTSRRLSPCSILPINECGTSNLIAKLRIDKPFCCRCCLSHSINRACSWLCNDLYIVPMLGTMMFVPNLGTN